MQRGDTVLVRLDEVTGQHAGYAGVLDRYSDWLIAQRSEASWTVIDVHGPMAAALADADLNLATRNALVQMIDLLQERGWTRQQAYIICSVAVDLRISNIVDLPNVTVSAFLPEDIFSS